MDSKILTTEEVSWYLLTWWSPFLNIGETQIFFQAAGKVKESSDLANNMDNGMLNSHAHSLSDDIGQPSGPDTLARFKLASLE